MTGDKSGEPRLLALRKLYRRHERMAEWECITVEGTWGSKRGELDWWRFGSPFWHYLITSGFARTAVPVTKKFHWDDSVEGIFGKNKRWKLGGERLGYYAKAYRNPNRKLLVIAHSHGGQVAAYAASKGMRIDCLVTVATPVRKDMKQTYEYARGNIGCWIHLYSDRSDWMQWFGSWFDGSWRLRRKMSYADQQIQIPGVGHSGLLNPAMWDRYNLPNRIKMTKVR